MCMMSCTGFLSCNVSLAFGYIGKSVDCASVEWSVQTTVRLPKAVYFRDNKSRASMVFAWGNRNSEGSRPQGRSHKGRFIISIPLPLLIGLQQLTCTGFLLHNVLLIGLQHLSDGTSLVVQCPTSVISVDQCLIWTSAGPFYLLHH